MDSEQQRIVKRVTTKAVKAVIYSSGNVQNILDGLKNMYDGRVYDILKPIILEAEQIAKNKNGNNDSIREFYCGRCMRFLDESCFNDGQRVKAKSGEGGYCLDCSSSTLVAELDVNNARIVRTQIPSPYMLSKRDKSFSESESATQAARESTTQELKNVETEAMLAWRRDPQNLNLMAQAFASVIQTQTKKDVLYIEIIFLQGDRTAFIQEMSKNWVKIETKFYILFSTTLDREITPQEEEEINSKAVSFKCKKVN